MPLPTRARIQMIVYISAIILPFMESITAEILTSRFIGSDYEIRKLNALNQKINVPKNRKLPLSAVDNIHGQGKSCISKSEDSNCFVPHEGPGCDDKACQKIVCDHDPACCKSGHDWDVLCAGTDPDATCGAIQECLCDKSSGTTGGLMNLESPSDSPSELPSKPLTEYPTVSFTKYSTSCFPEDSNCFYEHDEPGCDDSVCEAIVCQKDPACCRPGNKWDRLCAGIDVEGDCGARVDCTCDVFPSGFPVETDNPTSSPNEDITPRPTRKRGKRTKRPTGKPTQMITLYSTEAETAEGFEVAELPSEVPTENPSPRPTKRPTRKPTRKPRTKSPTRRPTRKPFTKRPTRIPTRKPTNSPTQIPSTSPSQRPTLGPSHHPSKSPTKNPTRSPTRRPTRKPTKIPTTSPSQRPTLGPSHRPSKIPTKNPIRRPTQRPTRRPTQNPTTFPTVRETTAAVQHTLPPSDSPLDVLSIDPTESPTFSCFPISEKSNCFYPHDGHGCDNPTCEEIVCNHDPRCCELGNKWDRMCAGVGVPCGALHNCTCASTVTPSNYPSDVPSTTETPTPIIPTTTPSAKVCVPDIPKSSSCFFEHTGPGCDNEACETIICSVDPVCCEPGKNWDDICAGTGGISIGARKDCLCEGADDNFTTKPTSAFPTEYPSEPPSIMTDIPSYFPTSELPSSPPSIGTISGACFPIPKTSNCFTPHDGPGCDSSACEEIVCSSDPACCEPGKDWDRLCAGDSNTPCGAKNDCMCEEEDLETVPSEAPSDAMSKWPVEYSVDPSSYTPTSDDSNSEDDEVVKNLPTEVPSDNATDDVYELSLDPSSYSPTFSDGSIGGEENECFEIPDDSNCFEAHGGKGCDNKKCQALICECDPSCCENKWDELCAGIDETLSCGARCDCTCH